MIYTLTLNPCVDKTVTLANFEIGATNRALSYEKSVCGKGINTSVVINNLGRKVFAFCIEYEKGESVKYYLNNQGIDGFFLSVPGELRTNIKIYDKTSGITTELNEKGVEVSKAHQSELINNIFKIVKDGDIFVISGSVPQGVDKNIYAELIYKLKKIGVYTILDADGELLKNGIKAKPDMIKPNKDELSLLVGYEINTLDDAVIATKNLCANGIKAVCVSLGREGAILVKDERVLRAYNDLSKEEIKGTVGAGDSMVAGFAIGISEKMSDTDTLKMASALAAGTVSLPSTELCTRDIYNKISSKVHLEELK